MVDMPQDQTKPNQTNPIYPNIFSYIYIYIYI